MSRIRVLFYFILVCMVFVTSAIYLVSKHKDETIRSEASQYLKHKYPAYEFTIGKPGSSGFWGPSNVYYIKAVTSSGEFMITTTVIVDRRSSLEISDSFIQDKLYAEAQSVYGNTLHQLLPDAELNLYGSPLDAAAVTERRNAFL